MKIEIINPKLDKIALDNKVKCHCCNRPALPNMGRVFFMGYWICVQCEDKCDPSKIKCSMTGHKRLS